MGSGSGTLKGRNMFGTQPISWIHRRLFRRVVACVCAVSFVIVFIFSAALMMKYAAHDHWNVPGCRSKLTPALNCVINDGQTQLHTRANTPAGTEAEPHNNAKAGCLACAMVQKTVDQLRQLSSIVCSSAPSDAALLVLAALCLLSMLAGPLTPVRLKIKNNN